MGLFIALILIRLFLFFGGLLNVEIALKVTLVAQMFVVADISIKLVGNGLHFGSVPSTWLCREKGI
ncbi:hypothetical protein [Vibrio parahaemolyticus]|uniref:hypothetical protein n=1 Tax=Vibrio parahaemolyticus TaxID=670 RepID=UPI0015D9901E|nr:hypothetical protein [Vibrio parahaemolyticus]